MIGARDPGRPAAVLALSDSAVAGLTIGISVYAAAILIGVGLAISAAQRGRRRLAITCAVIVGVLTIAGVIAAVLSSVA
ncbi:hypothetical protein ACLQ3C_08775 [Gordonia sp. DT30]|uniref:hypothetical protein n=1 Tax=unclassified Gordonia (in: high G+C Gram-positive bacteria) TaxID=2657482 RepID=UPI003CF1BF9A